MFGRVTPIYRSVNESHSAKHQDPDPGVWNPPSPQTAGFNVLYIQFHLMECSRYERDLSVGQPGNCFLAKMNFHFKIYGCFSAQLERLGISHRQKWDSVPSSQPGLADRSDCYVTLFKLCFHLFFSLAESWNKDISPELPFVCFALPIKSGLFHFSLSTWHVLLSQMSLQKSGGAALFQPP